MSAISSHEVPLKLTEILGAQDTAALQRFGIYLPNKDQHRNSIEISDWIHWAMQLLSKLNGGATAFPPTEGMWLDGDGVPLVEQTVFVYSYIRDVEKFMVGLPLLRAFLHKFGRDMNQGEVLVEFDNLAFWIRSYDGR